jgi:hypothetical protein
MNLRFALSDVAKGFVDTVVQEMQRPIAKAATASIRVSVASGKKAPLAAHKCIT